MRKNGEREFFLWNMSDTQKFSLLRPSSGGSMNPVRTLGPAVAAGNYKGIWIYMVAPTLGALAGAAIYTSVKLRDDEIQPSRSVRSFRR